MWFIFSAIALLSWAGSDLFSKKGTDPNDRYSHLRLIIMVGLFMGVHAIIFMLVHEEVYDPFNLIRYVPVSGLYILSMALGYAGLRYIELSVSSPICNSSGAIVAILCFFFLKESLAPAQTFAVVLISLGVVLLAIFEKRRDNTVSYSQSDKKYRYSALAIIFPIAYLILDALGTFGDAIVLDSILTEFQAQVSYELTFLTVAAIAFVYLVIIKKQRFAIHRERDFAAGALCETVGQFFYVYAMAAKPIAAAPMIASYCVFSVLLARIFLKEKLPKKYYAVIFMVFVGIVILGVFDV
jgi:drug/metabolite transporter (DMT)-like permease